MSDAAYADADSGEPDAAPSRAAAKWLSLITDAETYFQTYQDKADNVDKLYADLETMANTAREREMQIFWANLEVLKPSIYARPPVPVVVPRFKDRKELPRKASELLERTLCTSFDNEDIDATMRLIRDDLAISARGVVWLRYEAKGENGALTERIRYEHVERRDFLHDPARKWSEVGWVARRSYLARKPGVARFGDAFLHAEFKERKEENDEDEYKGEPKACVWELWHRDENVVVWVSPGMEDVLDEQPPHLTLEGFFPCPRPAYGTVQRRTLKPVPEFLYIKDQIEEINELTARISALSEGLRMKGFYAAGQGEAGDAIETAMKMQDNNAVLVPIANFGGLGPAGLKDAIVWLPVDQIAKVIGELVELRKQVIEDVYQVTGLSDIMRGSTDPNETLGAQQIKSQYGSIRIRDRQAELVRIARDITRMAAEIMAENFQPATLMGMSQVSDLPDKVAIEQQIKQITEQAKQAAQNPQLQQQAQQNPEAAQAIVQKVRAQVAQLEQATTLEQVMQLLREQRVRPFVLDIETDSTIQPDEDAAKQRATEFVTAVGGYMGQALPLVQAVPQAAPLAAEILKYVASLFRAGRQLEGTIDDFADQMKQAASQPKPPSPEAEAAQASMQLEQQKAQVDAQAKQQDAQLKQQATMHDAGLKQQSAEHAAQLAEQENAAKIEAIRAKMAADAEKHRQEMAKGQLELRLMQGQLRQIAAQTRATVVGARVKAAGAMAEGEDRSADEEGSIDFDPDFEANITRAVAALGDQTQAVAEALAGIASTLAAPVEVVRDANGEPVGVKRGNSVRPVIRRNGEVIGLQ
jgi:hypothetical protein